MRKPRHLSPEERALWDKVARTAKPMSRKINQPTEKSTKKSPKPSKPQRLAPFEIGQKVDHSGDHDLLPSLSEQIGQSPVAMDQKSFGRMRRGKLKPDARIDLHGMTLAEAHPALMSFVMRSHARGDRLLLVITGKGKQRDDGNPIPTRFGVLRHQVPQWLRMPPLSSMVLQVTEAHIRHGGQGAYYVYLRRNH